MPAPFTLHRRALFTGVMMLAAALAMHRDARACGGLFCDQAMPQPVIQTGEDVIFHTDGKSVEAHIQIRYSGAAPQFAWVLPVPAVPESIRVGAQPLFDRLLASTIPVHMMVASSTKCPRCTAQPPVMGGPPSDPFGGGGAGGGGSEGPPTAIAKGVIGAYDFVVLEGGTADAVVDWLNANGFQQSPLATPIFASYVAKNYRFVAVRLTNGAGVKDIHPLVVRYPGDSPCLPIQLTQVAAVQNMKIRTLFLDTSDHARWVPTNYRHVVLDELAVTAQTIGFNAFFGLYDPVLDAAFDAPVVNGHGFVSEYVGEVPPVGAFASSQWDTTALAAATPTTVVPMLLMQGFRACADPSGSGGGGGLTGTLPYCDFVSPLVRSTLETYLPVPAGVSESAFYDCVGCFSDVLDASKWDAAAFAHDIEQRVVVPMRHADEIIAASHRMTRMVTSLSPAEMTEDPDFHRIDSVESVSRLHQLTLWSGCDAGNDWLTFGPSETPVAMTSAGYWPAQEAGLTAIARVEDYPKDAAQPVVLVDNTAKNAASIAAWNAKRKVPFAYVAPECGGSAGAVGAGGAPGASGNGAIGGAPGGAPGASGHGAKGGAPGGAPAVTRPAGAGGVPAAGGTRAEAGAQRFGVPEAEGGCSTSGSEAPLGLTVAFATLLLTRRSRSARRA